MPEDERLRWFEKEAAGGGPPERSPERPSSGTRNSDQRYSTEKEATGAEPPEGSLERPSPSTRDLDQRDPTEEEATGDGPPKGSHERPSSSLERPTAPLEEESQQRTETEFVLPTSPFMRRLGGETEYIP